MSDTDPTPSKQTSSIPLKKETVRVTLKAADAPPAAPTVGIPTAPAVRPPVPTAPPVAGAPTAPPVATAPGAPRPAPAPTIPLKTTGAPSAPKPAPTIRLSPSPTAPAVPGAATAPAAKPALPGAATGASTIALPKATVQLQAPSAPLGSSLPTATYTSAADDDEDDAPEPAIVGILSGVGLVAALVVLGFQLSIANTWVNAEDMQEPGWGQLFK